MKDRPGSKLRIVSLFPHYGDAFGISHTALSVCGNLRNDQVEVRLFQPASDPIARLPFTRDAVPWYLKKFVYRLVRTEAIGRYTESVFLRSLRPDEAAYLWPAVSPGVYRRVKEQGHRLLIERINCHTATAKRILDDAYARLGLPPAHGITEEKIRQENEELTLANFVFAPSPLVEQSLRENGIPAEKILSSSYGWDPARLQGTRLALPPIDGLTVLFVGYVCVRKGAHLLLDAWARSGIRGRLVLAGDVAQEIADRCKDQLNRPDVLCLGYVKQVEDVFRSADVFAFPSLEEGSPLVMYEALAFRMPVVLSPMGAGKVVRHNKDGYVLDPYDRETWVGTLQRLAGDGELRRAMGEAARARAEEFTWNRVGSHRRELLLEALAKDGTARS